MTPSRFALQVAAPHDDEHTMLGVANEPVDSPTVELTRDAGAIITYVDEGIVDMLGWRPDELVGLPSTRFIHPEDQHSAIAAWMDMLTDPSTVRVWRGRYRAADGSWKWVETVNENRLSDPEGLVKSSMRRVSVEQVGVEEELRARTQLLSRLSDALPVGLVQIDASRNITFTNDRLHTIVGAPAAATIDALLSGVVAEDRPLLDAALTAVLADEPVDDIELTLEVPARRVCLLSLRALTDGEGTVTGAIGCLSDMTDRANLRRELQIRASVDMLTSCLNRAATIDLLTITVAAHDGTAPGTAVVYIDLDDFKLVNDAHGHAAGDRVLVSVSERLRAAVRGVDEVGRVGGDELLVVCPRVESAAQALEIGERLARVLHGPVDIGTGIVDIKASVGVAWTYEAIDADSLIAQADVAMYDSKRSGTSSTTLFDGVGNAQ
jgi:diguanylate cyclase (GGDEF)-like protein/PAS domain S-box-containing protein